MRYAKLAAVAACGLLFACQPPQESASQEAPAADPTAPAEGAPRPRRLTAGAPGTCALEIRVKLSAPAGRPNMNEEPWLAARDSS